MDGICDKVRLDLLTISLLRGGFETRGNRLARPMLGLEDPGTILKRVASSLWTDTRDVQPGIDRARQAAERALRSQPADAVLISILDDAYPELLRQITDPPLILWVHGDPATLSLTGVGIVGSRDATPASLAFARRVGRELSDCGVVVVSGLAYGVDAAAHIGALEGAGQTVAVLGSGLTKVYPKQHQALAQRIRERGAVISELPPDADSLPGHFPVRNRIISGLSRGVLVVEAAEHSGSLITARMAAEQNRTVMAVPGAPLSGRHRGSNGLIKDGARLVETVEDILDEIKWTGSTPDKKDGNSLEISELEALMAAGEPYSVDELAARTGRIPGDLVVELATLELAGRVTRLAGGQFARFPRPGC